jgi:hypothetical protein
MGKREIFGDSLVDYIRVCFATRRKKQEREREREKEREREREGGELYALILLIPNSFYERCMHFLRVGRPPLLNG